MCIQVHQRKEGGLLGSYVDDILLIGNDVETLSNVKKWLAEQLQMKYLGEASYILRIQIIRDRKNKLLALSQASYIDKVLAQFSMQDSKKQCAK